MAIIQSQIDAIVTQVDSATTKTTSWDKGCDHPEVTHADVLTQLAAIKTALQALVP